MIASAGMLATAWRALPAQTVPATDSQPAPVAPQSAAQLQELVAPIALYPDALVAQVLAASTYPAQIVEADRWLQHHPGIKGDALGDSVNGQSWDPSVKALTSFPSVLTSMDTNLTWTSSLGEAYVNQQAAVMTAVQTMRQRAQQAGKLQSDSQDKVTTQGNTIVIEPANPNVVYVPAYDPWTIYGGPIGVYPGWVEVPGVFYGGPGFAWGLGIGVGLGVYAGFDWGWHHWGADWHHHDVDFDHAHYVSHSTTFINRRTVVDRSRPDFAHGAVGHGGVDRGAIGLRQSPVGGRAPVDATHQAASGFGESRAAGGTRTSAFSGFGHGGMAVGASSRGHASLGGGMRGGGGMHGGGGGHR